MARPRKQIDLSEVARLRDEGLSYRAIARRMRLGVATVHRAYRAIAPDSFPKRLANRYSEYADSYRDALVKFYGAEQGRKVRYAQAFEVCEYGRQLSQDELKQMFPF